MLASSTDDGEAADAIYEATWHMIDELEKRELTDVDVSAELLNAEPPSVDAFYLRGGYFDPIEVNGPGELPECLTLGDCLLRRAAILGRTESARLLLRLGAHLDFAQLVEGARSPLVSACEAGHTEMVRLLLESGAQISAWTRCCEFLSVDEGFFTVSMDWTALHAACACGSLEAVRLLVEQRADPNLLCRYRSWYARGPRLLDREDEHASNGPSAFHLACARGHLDVVAYLHKTAGVCLETVGSMYGFSLCGASNYSFPWPIDMESSFFTWHDDNEDGSWGYIEFPDSYAIRCMDHHHRADDFPITEINACKILTGSALLLACVRGCADVIQYLLDAGAEADARGSDGWTPLSVAQAVEDTEVIELLLSAAGSRANHGARATPIRTRAQRAGIQLDETPPAVRKDIAEGGPATHERAKFQMRAIQKSRVQRVTRAEQTGTVRAALYRAQDAQRQVAKRTNVSGAGSRRVYTCKRCGEPKKGHVCLL